MPRCDATSTGYSQAENHATGGVVSYTFTYYSDNAGRPQSYGISGWDSVSASTGLSSSFKSTSRSGTSLGNPAATIFVVPSYISWTYWNGLMQHRNDQREYAFESRIPTWPKVLTLTNVWCSTDYMSIGAYSGQTNWGFADGHVKTMQRNQIMDATWNTNPTLADTNNLRNLIHWDGRFKN
jgi:prepilin-type processing-associated H-X9-DG protein